MEFFHFCSLPLYLYISSANGVVRGNFTDKGKLFLGIPYNTTPIGDYFWQVRLLGLFFLIYVSDIPVLLPSCLEPDYHCFGLLFLHSTLFCEF